MSPLGQTPKYSSWKKYALPALRPSVLVFLGITSILHGFGQTDQQIAKARAEWAMTDQQRADLVKEAHSLEQDWSHGMWVVRKPLFFSSYNDVDDYLSGRKIPDAAPLTPEFQAKAAALREEGKKNRAAVDTSAFTLHLKTMGISYNQDPNFVRLKPIDVACPLYGYPLSLIEPNPMKWEFGTNKIMQFYSGPGGISRLIKAGVSTLGFKGKFQFPARTTADGEGWAVAHWEGNVLTIDVSHVSWWYETESGFVTEVGVPHSEKLTATEKWWQSEPNTLHMELTINDPDALTKPWVVTKMYDRIDSDEVINRQCH